MKVLTKEEAHKAILLLAKAERSEDEQKELDALMQKCTDAETSLEAELELMQKDAPASGGDEGENDAEHMTEDDVKGIVTGAVKEALEGASIDPKDVLKSIEEMTAQGDSMSATLIEKAISDNIGDAVKLNNEQLLKDIESKLPSESLTREDVKEMFDSFEKKVTRGRKMEHDGRAGS